MTHWTSLKLPCSELCMSGSATLTIVTSISSISVATQTQISVHHLRSMTA